MATPRNPPAYREMNDADELEMHRLRTIDRRISWTLARAIRLAALALHRIDEYACNGTKYGRWNVTRHGPAPEYTEEEYTRDERRIMARLERVADAWWKDGFKGRNPAIPIPRRPLYFYHQTDPRGPSLYVSTKRFHRDDHTRNRSHAVGCRRY